VAERWYLHIDGIDGESVAAGHEKSIEILAWSWSVTQGAAISSGAGGSVASKPSFQEFDFVATISKASPVLVLACASGRHLETAVLHGVRGGGKSVKSLTYELSDVTVSSVQHADDEDGAPIEEFSLRYGTFEITYAAPDAGGKAATSVSAGWDIAKNQKL
jgi:type VI secretion system secreted protein Hcp